MDIYNKVIWTEGMFVRPQHFQQQERYLHYLSHSDKRLRQSYYWGFSHYAINEGLLAIGKLALERAEGILPDGTVFSFPEQDHLPSALDIEDTVRNQLVYFGLPIARHGVMEITADDAQAPLTRYGAYEATIMDASAENASQASLLLAKLTPRLLLESHDRSQYACLPVAKIKECRSDKQILLDEYFIPPCTTTHASNRLRGFLQEVTALLEQRSLVLAERIGDINRSNNMTVMTDFLLLQLVNRFAPICNHLQKRTVLHPEQFYVLFMDLLGSLSVFQPEKKLKQLPAYHHDNLVETYMPLMVELRQLMSLVVEPNAISIPLEQQKFGIEVAILHDRSYFQQGTFILAVHADVSSDFIRNQFPSVVKIGPAEKIHQLINLQLPGVALQPLAVAPPQIPYNVRYVYFELLPQGELWKSLKTSGSIAIHASGDFPGLKMELWVIRN